MADQHTIEPVGPPPRLDLALGQGCPHQLVALVLHPAVAAVVREALAAEATSPAWKDAEQATMERVIAALEAQGIRGVL